MALTKEDIVPVGLLGTVVAGFSDVVLQFFDVIFAFLWMVMQSAELWIPIIGRLPALAEVFGFLDPVVPYANEIAWIGSAALLGVSLARAITAAKNDD